MGIACAHEHVSSGNPVVFIVDDDVSVRESLEMLFQSAGWRTETFTCAQEFLSRPKVQVPCCLVLDLTLPDSSGLEVQGRVGADRSWMPVIFITGLADVRSTVQAMKAGAFEFFTKPLNDEALLDAIRQAISRSSLEMASEAQRQALDKRYATLTTRERQVMELVVHGHLNKQIGGKLEISEITVKAHRGKMMRKMQAACLVDLINKMSMLRPAPARYISIQRTSSPPQ